MTELRPSTSGVRLLQALNSSAILLLSGAFFLGTSIPSSAAEPCYPGLSPGPVAASVTNSILRFSNSAVTVSWRFADPGLRAPILQHLQSGESLQFTGEVFCLTFSDRSLCAASSMKCLGPPVLSRLKPDPQSPRLADRLPGWQAELTLAATNAPAQIRWRVIARDTANYVRQEIIPDPASTPQQIQWLHEFLPGAHIVGRVDGSPIVAGNFFFGCEDPMAVNTGTRPGPDSQGPITCYLPCDQNPPNPQKPLSSFVLGVAPPGQMRRAFLYYLEHERAHPYRPFLHYNSWYDLSWPGFPMNETNCLAAIRAFGENFIRPFGVTMDAIVFDDGWDNPDTLWRFHPGFPRGFAPHAELCRQYQTRLGVWLSPFGGYGQPKSRRLISGSAAGYETNAAGFSLAGSNYFAAFKTACVTMMRQYGVCHFKFDGIASGMYANGPGPNYLRDTQALRKLMSELRAHDPNLYINFTTGSWPSPFWLRYADSLWRQGDDMGFTGKGNQQQRWLTYRDREVYRNIVGKAPLYPLNALMTQGVAWSRHGPPAHADFNSSGFKDDVHAFFGSGTGLQELYIQPQRLTPNDWRTLARAAQWSRANANVLVDTHWIGGDPAKSEIYGYASWTPAKAIFMLRNPDDQSRLFALVLAKAFELPPGAPTTYLLNAHWPDDGPKPPVPVNAATSLTFQLQPFEIVIFEATPAQSTSL